MIQPLQPSAGPSLGAAPNHLATVLPLIRTMIGNDAHGDAVALLSRALAGWNSRTALPHVFLIEAARTYACLLRCSDISSARAWARYVHRAACHLYGSSDRRTIAATADLRWALPAAPAAVRAGAPQALDPSHLVAAIGVRS